MTDFESVAVSGFVIFGPLVEEELTLLAVEKSASIRYFNGTLVSRLELLGKLISEMKTLSVISLYISRTQVNEEFRATRFIL